MNLKTTAIAAGLAAALGTGVAFAQSYSDSAPPQAYGHHRGHHHGIRALIREEVQAGRISQQEGALLEQRIRELKAERRASRQGMQGNYGQGNYAPPR
jgi:hypothetical protein